MKYANKKTAKYICILIAPYMAYWLAGKYMYPFGLPNFTLYTGDIVGCLNYITIMIFIKLFFDNKA